MAAPQNPRCRTTGNHTRLKSHAYCVVYGRPADVAQRRGPCDAPCLFECPPHTLKPEGGESHRAFRQTSGKGGNFPDQKSPILQPKSVFDGFQMRFLRPAGLLITTLSLMKNCGGVFCDHLFSGRKTVHKKRLVSVTEIRTLEKSTKSMFFRCRGS